MINNNKGVLAEEEAFDLLTYLMENLLFTFKLRSIDSHITDGIDL
jgi:hypothetical protein